MVKVSDIIKLAQAWIGKNEADGSFKEIIDIYNSQKPLPRGYKVKYTDAWCATFISALVVKLNCTNIIPTECSCQKMIQKFKDIGCWQENENITPKAGYIIFYDWQDTGSGDDTGWADHVGIVEKVSGNKITVIEGNYNTKVARRTLEVNARYIRGYAVPKYEAEAVAKPVAKPTTTEKVSKLKYKEGDTVTYDTIYSSSNSEKALKPSVTSGKITRVIEGRKHPYLINGGTGWVDDDCITTTKKTTKKAAIKKGDKVKVIKKVNYKGKSFKTYYDTYDVIQVEGDRVVIGIGEVVTTAIHIDNIEKV